MYWQINGSEALLDINSNYGCSKNKKGVMKVRILCTLHWVFLLNTLENITLQTASHSVIAMGMTNPINYAPLLVRYVHHCVCVRRKNQIQLLEYLLKNKTHCTKRRDAAIIPQ